MIKFVKYSGFPPMLYINSYPEDNNINSILLVVNSNAPYINKYDVLPCNLHSYNNMYFERNLSIYKYCELLACNVKKVWNNAWIGYYLEVSNSYLSIEQKSFIWKMYFPENQNKNLVINDFNEESEKNKLHTKIMQRLFSITVTHDEEKAEFSSIAIEMTGNIPKAIEYRLCHQRHKRVFSMAVLQRHLALSELELDNCVMQIAEVGNLKGKRISDFLKNCVSLLSAKGEGFRQKLLEIQQNYRNDREEIKSTVDDYITEVRDHENSIKKWIIDFLKISAVLLCETKEGIEEEVSEIYQNYLEDREAIAFAFSEYIKSITDREIVEVKWMTDFFRKMMSLLSTQREDFSRNLLEIQKNYEQKKQEIMSALDVYIAKVRDFENPKQKWELDVLNISVALLFERKESFFQNLLEIQQIYQDKRQEIESELSECVESVAICKNLSEKWMVDFLKVYVIFLSEGEDACLQKLHEIKRAHLNKKEEITAEIEYFCMQTGNIRWLEIVDSPNAYQRLLYAELRIQRGFIPAINGLLNCYNELLNSTEKKEDREIISLARLKFCMRQRLHKIAIHSSLCILQKEDSSNTLKRLALDILTRPDTENLVMDRVSAKKETKTICLIKAKMHLNPLSAYFSLAKAEENLLKAEQFSVQEDMDILLQRFRLACLQGEREPGEAIKMRIALKIGQNPISRWYLSPVVIGLSLPDYNKKLLEKIRFLCSHLEAVYNENISLEQRFAIAKSFISKTTDPAELYALFSSPVGLDLGNLAEKWDKLDRHHQIQIVLDLEMPT